MGFLSIYPSIFNGFVFALSCVSASAMLKELAVVHHDANVIWMATACWIVAMLAVFVDPLLVFVRPLYEVRERALLEYGCLANEHHLAFHSKWIREARSGEELMGSSDASSASDLNAAVQAAQDMRFIPIDSATLTQLVVAAAVPLLAVAAMQVPVLKLVGWAADALL